MAIEKNYLSTYGWEVPDAYYKLDDSYHKLPLDQTPKNDDDSYKNYWVFTVNVYRNRASRDLSQDPLAQNVMKIEDSEKQPPITFISVVTIFLLPLLTLVPFR